MKSSPGRRPLAPALPLLGILLLTSGCAVWNPWGYSKDWPLWKKTLFFAGPGHCPVCYCVGGAVIEAGGFGKDDEETAGDSLPATENAPAQPEAGQARSQPKLLDLGSGQCVPCKMMKPVLEELQTDYAEHFETVYLDISENREAAQQYGIRAIPTQIFYDAESRELFRHEGYMAKEDILAKWQELGYALAGEPQNNE
jgi:thioredoxin 1